MNMAMKRTREAEFNSLTMANCLILLANTTQYQPTKRSFECKTCNRQFPSFQALGGHRASHKKPKLGCGGGLSLQTSPVVTKPKSHECSICGVEFGIGQALGGHMRRHRVVINEKYQSQLPPHEPDTIPVEPALKKPKSGKRVWCLDLNLTVMENDLEFEMGMKKIPHVVN